MSKELYSDSDGYSSNDVYSNGGSDTSNSLSDMSTSTGNMPELFTVGTGPCTGSYERIELLIRQAKTVNIVDITEEQKNVLFKNVVIRSEAESVDSDPWITSIFSIILYPEIKSMLHPKVCSAIEKLPRYIKQNIIISARFTNVPEEVIFEMYDTLSGICDKLVKTDPTFCMLLLSLEKPVGKEEEAEIKRVFPNFKFPRGTALFPDHTEDVFLILNNEPAQFACNMGNSTVIKGYALTVEAIHKFVKAMKEFYT